MQVACVVPWLIINKPNNDNRANTKFNPIPNSDYAVNGHCGIHRDKSSEERSHTDPETSIDYTCAIEDEKLYIRKITCTPRCDKSGEPVICRVKNNFKRSRRFKCTPTDEFPGFGNIYEDFVVYQQSKCECFKLSDVELACPTTRPPVRCPTTAPADISNRP